MQLAGLQHWIGGREIPRWPFDPFREAQASLGDESEVPDITDKLNQLGILAGPPISSSVDLFSLSKSGPSPPY